MWQHDDTMLPFLVANNMKRYVLQDKPTTEKIAAEILIAVALMFHDYRVVKVHVTEGPHNAATVYGGDL